MHYWEKFNETALTEKKIIVKKNIEDIADADYTHRKKFLNVLKQGN